MDPARNSIIIFSDSAERFMSIKIDDKSDRRKWRAEHFIIDNINLELSAFPPSVCALYTSITLEIHSAYKCETFI